MYGIILLMVSSILPVSRLPIQSFALWSLVKIVLLWAMFRIWDKSYHPPQISVWMLMVSVSLLVGIRYCRDYWDWKQYVNNVINYSICLTALLVCVPDVLQKILSFLYRYIWIVFIVLVLFLTSDGIAKFMLPFSFLALFYASLDSKYRKYVCLALMLTIVFGYYGRSEVVKFLFCIAIGLFSLRHEIGGYLRKLYWLFFVLPFVLFTLAATETFNIFQLSDELGISVDETSRIDMSDTRTLLYEEVIATTIDRGTIWFGNTPARGYYSEWMIRNQDLSDVMGDVHFGERGNTESSVLNVYMHFGIFGMIVYLLLFLSASYLGIFKSNNTYIPIVGFYVAFRYMFGWVEDFTNFDLNMFFLWSMVGMCYSPYFREMTDEDFREWLGDVLS